MIGPFWVPGSLRSMLESWRQCCGVQTGLVILVRAEKVALNGRQHDQFRGGKEPHHDLPSPPQKYMYMYIYIYIHIYAKASRTRREESYTKQGSHVSIGTPFVYRESGFRVPHNPMSNDLSPDRLRFRMEKNV